MSTVTDPIADLLARMRNGARAQKIDIYVPYSKVKAEVVRILKNEGYRVGTLTDPRKVEDELRNHVGRAYVISYYTSKEGEDETLTLSGHSYPYKVSTTAADERAELVEIDAP